MVALMKYLGLTLLFAILLPGSLLAYDVEYAIRIRESVPEFGNRVPRGLCEDERPSPCRLPVYLLYDVVPDIEDTKENLSAAAYSALKRNSRQAQVVWEFNLCKPRWDKDIPCVEVLGYLVVKDYKVVFYAFQNP